MNYITIPLNKLHDRKVFDCENEILNHYLQKQVNQDIKRKLCLCFVLQEEESNKIKGFYTLSSNSIPQDLVPEDVRKKMPNSYKDLPTILLGRLAIDKDYRGQGYGRLLLIDSLKRSYKASQEVLGSIAVIVDPINEEAERFYLKYGFLKLPDSGKMFLSMKTVEQLF